MYVNPTTEGLFADIYKGNRWGNGESFSGPGSDTHQTRIIVKELPFLFREAGAKRILDIPCGDFNWMRRVDLNGFQYTGADIVKDLVSRNSMLYGTHNIRFLHLDILADRLPVADIILCRDCLVHFSFHDIFRALINIQKSGTTFLLTTSFLNIRKNLDIPTGLWRPINLQIEPFSFPPPLRIVVEGCTEGGGKYRECVDKSLALWKINP